MSKGKKHTYTSTGGRAELPDTLPKSVEDWLAGGAPEGQRNRTLLGICCQLRDIRKTREETDNIIRNRAMADGLPEWEIDEVLGNAFSRPPRELPTGAIDTNTGKRVGGEGDSAASQVPKAKGRYKLKKRQARQHREDTTAMDRAAPMPVPAPLEDGFRTILESAFEEGEGVCVAGTTEGKPDRGAALTREEWLEKLETKGSLDKIFSGKEGVFIRLNPVKPRGQSRNEDVTSFRHVLVEFDEDAEGNTIPKDKQFGAFLASNLPITCVLDSGRKSLHAWVRVDAEDAKEYEERAAQAYSVFTGSMEGLDEGNHNPNRFSRCPEGWRTVNGEERLQTIVHLHMGATDWTEWEAHKEAAEFGAPMRFSQLMEFPVKNDPNNVLGNRWLCRGGSVVWVSQSGVGKSSLLVQLSHGWAKNDPSMTFGIKAIRPLKQLIIQAENDDGDVAEAIQDVAKSFDLHKDAALFDSLIEWRRISTMTGEDFLNRLEGLVRLTRPDIVWIDPLLNFIGDDIKDQAVVSKFCVEGLNPISQETGCIFSIIHHTGKPMSADNKRGRTASDKAYSGLGSSNLTNWSREVVNIERVPAPEGDPATFALTCTKRRKRAGMLDMDGNVVEEIHIRHGKDSILWEQCEKPAEEAKQGSEEQSTSRRFKRGSKKPESENGPGRPTSFNAATQLKIADFVETHCGGDVRMVAGAKLDALCRLLEKSKPTVRGWLREMGKAREEAEKQGA